MFPAFRVACCSQQWQQAAFRDTIPMQPRGGSDPYRGSSVNDFSRIPTNSWGNGASSPWQGSEYYFPYGHFGGQGGISHSGFPVVADQAQVSNNAAMNFPHSFPGTTTRQNSQGATPIWQFSNLNWVNYEAHGEMHLVIVFRKFPFA
ncbi:hypothetical protein EI94DRAFT_1705825 [Lactarius quietus]|nr:hypothetical protein EI94DRAFT_1705825 [Lactarius quietus]